MAVVYEVWDMGTANQIGAFPTQAEAEALLLDVLDVNSPDVAREMVILAYSGELGDDDPTLVLEGDEFVARIVRAHA